MHTATSRQLTRRPSTLVRTPSVCIVDPQPTEYDAWRAAAEQGRLRLRVASSSDEALRLARSSKFDLWLVNTALPGLSGCELCSMLKSRQANAAVYLMADHYSPAVEQSAWAARATMFGVKGDASALLDHWLEHTCSDLVTDAIAA